MALDGSQELPIHVIHAVCPEQGVGQTVRPDDWPQSFVTGQTQDSNVNQTADHRAGPIAHAMSDGEDGESEFPFPGAADDEDGVESRE